MASLQSLRRKIASVKNTQKITKAMKMVAAAKLKRAQDRILAARPYAVRMREILERVSQRVDRNIHPLFHRRPAHKVEIVAISSDRGLCGAFNANVLRRAVQVLEEHKARGAQVSVSVVGRKGLDFFRRREWPIRAQWPGVFDRLTFEHAKDLGQDVIEHYTKGTFDELYVVSNDFKSVMQQEVLVRKALPIDLRDAPESPQAIQGGGYLYEPNEEEIFAGLPEVVYILAYRILLESAAAEQAARMTAMDGATRNAGELIDKITLFYNKTRQAGITKELMDIVGGAEALK
jgi:F-type H+-transporting ATPase subunit gamma